MALFAKKLVPVSEHHKFTALADSLSESQLNRILRRVPRFYLQNYLAQEGFALYGPEDLKACRSLARALDRHADQLQCQIDDRNKQYVSEPH